MRQHKGNQDQLLITRQRTRPACSQNFGPDQKQQTKMVKPSLLALLPALCLAFPQDVAFPDQERSLKHLYHVNELKFPILYLNTAFGYF